MTPSVVDDGYEDLLWVGDDQILTGPLDMQTLLLLELAGEPHNFQMDRAVSPRFTMASSLNEYEFLEISDLAEVDSVIIQVFGIHRDFSEEDFDRSAYSWINFLRAQGKEVIVFYPWFSIVDPELEQERLDQMIHKVVWQENLVMIPVGPAWRAALKERPNIQLHASDGIHPSALGVYLSACVFYASLTGESPMDNPVYTSIGYDLPGDIVKLDGDTLEFLQTIAWETINEYRQKDEFRVMIKESP
jgi:hypothetical protein